MATAKARQCIVIPGEGVNLLWGTSAEGFPCVTIKPASDRSSPLFDKDDGFGAKPTSSWTYDEVPKARGIITFCTNGQFDTSGEDPNDGQADLLLGLRQKIDDQWPKRARYLRSRSEKWCSHPSNFYGVIDTISSLEFSLKSVIESLKRRDKEQRVQHMCHLAHAVDERVEAGRKINPSYREATVRRVLLETLCHGLGIEITDKTARRTFDYAIDIGRVFNKIDGYHSAFSFTVGPILSRDESMLVRHHSTSPFPWISVNVLEEISHFKAPAQTVRTYLWQTDCIMSTSTSSHKRSRTETEPEEYDGRHGIETASSEDTGRGAYLEVSGQTDGYVHMSPGSVIPVRGGPIFQTSTASNIRFNMADSSTIRVSSYDDADGRWLSTGFDMVWTS